MSVNYNINKLTKTEKTSFTLKNISIIPKSEYLKIVHLKYQNFIFNIYIYQNWDVILKH